MSESERMIYAAVYANAWGELGDAKDAADAAYEAVTEFHEHAMRAKYDGPAGRMLVDFAAGRS